MKKITLVRFVEHIQLGKGLDPKSYVEDGGFVQGVPVKLSKHDDSFLRIDFNGKDKVNKYSQLVPWNTVATVMFED